MNHGQFKALRIFWRGAFLLVLAALIIYACSGCATFKNVLRTVDDLASDACTLFGTRHPEEFRELVRQRAPALYQKSQGRGLDVVKGICAVKEVVQPFINDQLWLQQSAAAAMRSSMQRDGGVGADPPQ